jgi:hypothetical protein
MTGMTEPACYNARTLGKLSERGIVIVGFFGGAEETDNHIPF